MYAGATLQSLTPANNPTGRDVAFRLTVQDPQAGNGKESARRCSHLLRPPQ